MSEEETAGKDDPKEMIKERVVNIGDILESSESDDNDKDNKIHDEVVQPGDEGESLGTEQQAKSWNERIPRMFSRVTAVGLTDPKKEEYIGDTEEVVAVMCEFFDAEHNLPLLLQELGSGELTPKQSIMYLGICMIGYLLVARMQILEKIGEKMKLRNKKEVKK